MRFLPKEITLRDGSPCILRSPEPKDAALLLKLIYTTSDETHFLLRYPEEVTVTLEEEEALLQKTLDSPTDMMISAFRGEKLVGNAGIHTVGTFEKIGHRATFGFSICRKHWSMGIGSALMRETQEQARLLGYEQIELGVFSDNARAQGLYQRDGFSVWGRIKNAYRLKDGSYRDEIVMGKRLV